jgi:hypothetical protein
MGGHDPCQFVQHDDFGLGGVEGLSARLETEISPASATTIGDSGGHGAGSGDTITIDACEAVVDNPASWSENLVCRVPAAGRCQLDHDVLSIG